MNTVKALDVSKSTEIVDAKGNIRYLVVFSSAMVNASTQQLGYATTVFHFYPGSPANGEQILRIPENGYETDYHKAQEDFKTCVGRYRSLVKAETKDYNDIDIYKEKINYKVTKPECCSTCRWCWTMCMRQHHRRIAVKYECHNPMNQQAFNYCIEYPPFPSHEVFTPPSGWQKLPWQKFVPSYADPRLVDNPVNPIFPGVDPLGKCSNYENACSSIVSCDIPPPVQPLSSDAYDGE